MADLRVAVIGCGGIGGIHLSRWANVSGATVVAVCDVDPGVAARVASEFGADSYTDWNGLIEETSLDIVDVCTPPNEHAPITLAALDRNCHVLCEKPLALSATAARTMVDRAQGRGRLLMTAFCHRFHPPILFARELIENDDLGRVVMFRNRFSGSFPGIEDRWFANPEIAGGGALIDTGVHSIDLFRFLVGEVASACGYISTFNPKLRVEDSAALLLTAENGALGVVECSWSTPSGRNVLEIYGTAGACIVDYDSGNVRYRTADMSVWEIREPAGPDRFQREISHFADAVRGNQSLDVTGEDGLRTMEIIEQVMVA